MQIKWEFPRYDDKLESNRTASRLAGRKSRGFARIKGGICLVAFFLTVYVSMPTYMWAQSDDSGTSPRHFIYFGLERSRISDVRFLSTPSIAGAQLKYTWKELEPERDRYEFDAIRSDLAFLDSYDKQLFIQLQDVSFDRDRINVSDYLLGDASFGGGVAMKYEFEDDDESRPIEDGWVSRRWDPAVRERFARLLGALAEAFDGRIAGLNLAETSIGFGGSGDLFPAGFTYDAYFIGIKDLMLSARQAFRVSDVIIYANFMPGEELPDNDNGYLKGVYEYADRIGAGIGGPDLLPHRWYQQQHSLPLIAKRVSGTVAGMAIQWGNLEDTNRRTGGACHGRGVSRIRSRRTPSGLRFLGYPGALLYRRDSSLPSKSGR